MLAASLLLKKKVVVTTASPFSTSMKAAGTVLSNSNYTGSFGNAGNGAFGNVGHATGKWYFEMTIDQSEGSATPLVGIASVNTTYTDPWKSGGKLLWYGSGNQVIYGSSDIRQTYSSFTTGDRIGMAVDLTAGIAAFYRNGVGLTGLTLSSYISPGTIGSTVFYPMASSPHALVGGGSIVSIAKNPLYTPAGYGLW